MSPDRREAPVIINASKIFSCRLTILQTVVVKLYAGEPGRSSFMTWYELHAEG